MNSTYRCKNLRFLSLGAAGVFLASAFLFLSSALAAEEAQIEAAIKDLSSVAGQTITSEDQAREFCNQEKNFQVCADIGKQHDLYGAEEIKKVDNFLLEIKGKILDDIKNCSDEECLGRVAGELAKKLQTKNPALATDFKLTAIIVAEKQAVTQAAKEVGVDFKDCEAMNPDTAPVDLLRKCARLAKDTRVQKYIPEEKRVLANQFGDSTIKLREGLTTGKYQCGDGTLEGCGNFCLNPTAEAKAAGIPAVCKQIASEVFGAKGVKELEAAHQQVEQVKDYYSKKFILTLPGGKELVGEGQIRNACDEAFSGQTSNFEVAKACGAFAVQNGFAGQAEVDKGLKLLESFNQRGQNANFDQCISNPAACRDFIPEDERGQFDAGSQIFEIMKTEIGFDPSQCERGAVDETIGAKCFEGSKRALAKIESSGLAQKSREARFIIEDIKRHVTEGEGFAQRKDEFRQVFSQQGGPGGCKSESECFAYCSDPKNGPECIAFGAKQGISGFRGQEAVQKFQEYNQNIQKPGLTYTEYKGEFSQSPGQGPYQGFQPPGQGGFPPGQIPGFTQPGPGFNFGPVGPSPECFAAIQSGDFTRAKITCDTSQSNLPVRQVPICPVSPYVECPAGQYRDSFQNRDGCWIDGPCRPTPTYSAGPYPTYGEYQGDANSCPGFAHSKWDATGKRFCRLNGSNSCQYNYPAYLDQVNYAPGNCPLEYSGSYTPYPTSPGGSSPACPSGQWWDYTYNRCTSAPACGPGYWWDSSANTCKPSSTSSCSASLTNLLGSGCHYMYNDSSGRSIFCDGPMSKSAKEGDTTTTAGCSGGGYTYTPYPTTTTSTYSPSPTTTSTGSSCPTGSHTMGSYCMSDSDGTKCGPLNSTGTDSFGSCSSYTGSTTSYSPYPTTTGTGSNCPSGYHFMISSNECMSDTNSAICQPAGGGATRTCSYGSISSYSPYPTVSTYSGSCSASLTNLLGSGCHYMYNDSSGRSIFCDGPMSKSAKEGDTTTTAGCSGGGYTYTPYPTTTTSTYSPSPTTTSTGSSCPTGSHTMGSYCMSDSDGTKCGPIGSTGVSGFGSCSTYQTTTTYSPYPTYSSAPTYSASPTSTYTYTPPPTCPSGQYWDGGTSTCKSSCTSTQYWNGSACVDNVTVTPYPTATYTYTPAPTYETTYTPAPTYSTTACPSGQFWDEATHACKSGTVFNNQAHQMAMVNTIMACLNSGSQWDSGRSVCAVKNSGFFANVLKVFSNFLTGR